MKRLGILLAQLLVVGLIVFGVISLVTGHGHSNDCAVGSPCDINGGVRPSP